MKNYLKLAVTIKVVLLVVLFSHISAADLHSGDPVSMEWLKTKSFLMHKKSLLEDFRFLKIPKYLQNIPELTSCVDVIKNSTNIEPNNLLFMFRLEAYQANHFTSSRAYLSYDDLTKQINWQFIKLVGHIMDLTNENIEMHNPFANVEISDSSQLIKDSETAAWIAKGNCDEAIKRRTQSVSFIDQTDDLKKIFNNNPKKLIEIFEYKNPIERLITCISTITGSTEEIVKAVGSFIIIGTGLTIYYLSRYQELEENKCKSSEHFS